MEAFGFMRFAPRRERMALRRKVMVFVYRTTPKFEVLLLKRVKADKGDWHPVTGNVEAHEPIHTAAAREVEEETGLEGTLQPLGITFTFEDKKRNARYHETAFSLKIGEKGEVELSEEHTAHEWLAPEAAMTKLSWPDQKKALEALIQKQA